MRSKLVIIALGASLSACVAERASLSTPFSPQEHAFAIQPGSAIVYGQVAYRGASGAVVTNPGQPVYLIPKTRYTVEVIAKYRGDFTKSVDIQNIDGRLGSYVRRAAIAPGGTFVFGAVPPGRYIVVTNIEELIPAIVAGYNGRSRSLVGEVTAPFTGSAGVLLDH